MTKVYKTEAESYITWVPVTTAWHILMLRMDETASRYGV